MDLLTRVLTYIEERELLHPGETVVVGVSGGPDSLCLLDLLHRLSLAWRWQVHVAHLNHRLRPEAAVEADLVRAEAEKRGLDFFAEAVDVRAYAAQHKQSIEEAARNCRYEFLARVAGSVEAACVAVAHTADDQAETVLMHTLRGSGLAGLRGMLPRTVIPRSDQPSPEAVSLIRPLLHVSRAEVTAYCAAHGLQPVQDPSNANLTFFRNRLRHELLPALETYNPNIRAALSRMAEVAAGEHELLDRIIADVWKRVVLAEGLAIEFNRERWLALSVPEQRALLRRAIQRLRADDRNVDFTPLEQAVRFSRKAQPGRRCDVLGGLQLHITPDAIILRPWGDGPVPDDLPLLDTQAQLLPGWRFTVKQIALTPELLALIESQTERWEAFVDAQTVVGEWGLSLRPRRVGDRFSPLGLNQHRVKLSDLFINAKIEGLLRDHWPLVVNGDDIVWVAGVRLEERFKVTSDTQMVLHLSFTKIE